MTMRAVVISSPGGPEALEVRDVEDLPAPGDGEVLVKVAAAGVNRADTVQRQGKYPPPPGASLYPGLECSGTILALGTNVPPRWAVGDQVCALLTGGGYAEKVVVPAGQLLPVPEGVSLTDAAGLPEVACTVWSTVFMTSHLSPGESFLRWPKDIEFLNKEITDYHLMKGFFDGLEFPEPDHSMAQKICRWIETCGRRKKKSSGSSKADETSDEDFTQRSRQQFKRQPDDCGSSNKDIVEENSDDDFM